jgi:hypothetical protein
MAARLPALRDTTSTPQSIARRASAAVPTVCSTIAPASFARATRGPGSRQKKEMIGTRSSRQTARRSSCGKSRFRFTPNGRAVSARVSWIGWRIVSASERQSTSIPKPPALLTDAARAGPTAPPIGAWMIGRSMPSLSQRAVFMGKSRSKVRCCHAVRNSSSDNRWR